MTREDALELVERMPYIRTIQVAADKVRSEFTRRRCILMIRLSGLRL